MSYNSLLTEYNKNISKIDNDIKSFFCDVFWNRITSIINCDLCDSWINCKSINFISSEIKDSMNYILENSNDLRIFLEKNWYDEKSSCSISNKSLVLKFLQKQRFESPNCT
jgi:hypothetical protein